MGNANSPQRGGAGFLHDPLLASPSSAVAAAAAAAAAAGGSGGEAARGPIHGAVGASGAHQGTGTGSPDLQQEQHRQHRQRQAQALDAKPAAVASPDGVAVAGGHAHAHPVQQEGCGLMLGGEDSMSAWLDGAARHAESQEAAGGASHGHPSGGGTPGAGGGRGGGDHGSIPTPGGAIRAMNAAGPVTSSPTTASPGGALVMDWGDLTAAVAVAGGGPSPLRSPGAISAAAAAVSLGSVGRPAGVGASETAAVVTATAGPAAAAAAAAMLSLSPESLPPPPQEHPHRLLVSPAPSAGLAAVMVGGGGGGGITSTIGGFGNISITLKKAGGGRSGGGAGGGRKQAAAPAAALGRGTAKGAAAEAGAGGGPGTEEDWDVPPDMLIYAAALPAANGGAAGPFDEDEDDDDFVREEVDSSEDEGEGGLDEELEAALLGTAGAGFGGDEDEAGPGSKGAPEAVSKRGRQRRPSAKAVAAGAHEDEGNEFALGAEALLPLPFNHGEAAAATSSGATTSSCRGAAKRSRTSSSGGAPSTGTQIRRGGKVASTPAQSSSRATSVQLVSLMPTPSATSPSSLLLQLKPPALPLDGATFQSVFGEKLQKELDHYLTYGRNVSAQYWADTLRKEMARAVWMVQALGAPHDPLDTAEDLARVLSTGRAVVTQLYRMGKDDVFPGTAPCSEASILRRRAALNILLEAVGLKAEKMPPRRKEGSGEQQGAAEDGKENLGEEGYGDETGSPADGSGSAMKPAGSSSNSNSNSSSSSKKGKSKGGGAASLLPTPSSQAAGGDGPPSYKRRNSTKGGKIHKTPLAREMERKLEAFLIREHHLTLASAANYLSHVRTMLREALEKIGEERRGLTGPEAALALHSPALVKTEYAEDRPSYWSAFLKFLKQEHGFRTVGCGMPVPDASSSASSTAAAMPTPATATTKGTTGSSTGGRSSSSLAPPSTTASKRSHGTGGGVKRARLSMNEPLVAPLPALPFKEEDEEEDLAAGAGASGTGSKASGRRTMTKSLSSGHFQLVATSGSSKSRRKGAAAKTPAEEVFAGEAGQTPLTTAAAGGGKAEEEGMVGMSGGGLLPAEGLMPKPAPIRLSINDPHRPTLKFVTPSPQNAPSSGSHRRGRMMKL